MRTVRKGKVEERWWRGERVSGWEFTGRYIVLANVSRNDPTCKRQSSRLDYVHSSHPVLNNMPYMP